MPGPSSFTCRVCHATEHTVLFAMDATPHANAFVKPLAPPAGKVVSFVAGPLEPDRTLWPTTLTMCRACRLLQTLERPSYDAFTTQFPWVSGTSATMRQHAVWFSGELAKRHIEPGRLPGLLEIASNDGTLLRACREVGFNVTGIDPSAAAQVANQAGLRTYQEPFTCAWAKSFRERFSRLDVLVARNVLGHVPDPGDLLAGMSELLAPGGRVYIESPYALLLRDQLQYDTIFHEHTCYWTITTLARAASMHGLTVAGVGFSPLNGGSFLVELAHADEPNLERDDLDGPFIALEALQKINDPAGWHGFAHRVERQRNLLANLLLDLWDAGKVTVAYGAAAKAIVMANHVGYSPTTVRAFGDANALKQGLLTPGGRIPVVSPEALLALTPDYVLIGAWNYRDEVMSQLRAMGYSGRFIVPAPVPEIVDG